MSTVKEDLDFEDKRLEGGEGEQLDVDENTASADEIERASRMGWTDKDAYTGPAERWVDAKTFIKRGEEIMPILKDRLRKQDDDLKGMRAELRQVVQNQGQYERDTRERIQGEFDQRKRAAVEAADTEAYDSVHKEEQTWQTRPPPAAAQPAAPEGNAILKSWQAENSWFDKDEELTEFANDTAGVIGRRYPHLLGTAELLNKVAERTRKVFPEKFTNPNREGKGDVEGSRGPSGGSGRRGKETYANMPAAARAKCDQYVNEGWSKSREEYVDIWYEEERK